MTILLYNLSPTSHMEIVLYVSALIIKSQTLTTPHQTLIFAKNKIPQLKYIF
jgi:hypothetical protein